MKKHNKESIREGDWIEYISLNEKTVIVIKKMNVINGEVKSLTWKYPTDQFNDGNRWRDYDPKQLITFKKLNNFEKVKYLLEGGL